MTSSTPALELREVAVARSGRTIWSDGSFTVPSGAFAAVLGPNGSGKTTFLHLILGLLTPAHGTVQVLGNPARRGNPRIGYVPQNYAASNGDALRARDLVSLGLAGTRWGLALARDTDHARVHEALRAVDAAGFADSRMSQLSGGQQQRVAVAQAIVSRPDLLLLDEPLANLDVKSQREIVLLLSRLRRDLELTILVVVHDINPLVSELTSAVYLVDGHAHHAPVDDVIDEELLTHLYGTRIKVVRTAQGDLYTKTA